MQHKLRHSNLARPSRTRPLQVLAAAWCGFALCALSSGCNREEAPAFDLPAAMGADFRADIDTLSARLGPPQSQNTNELGLPTRVWKKGNATLTAAYKATSKRVVSLSVVARTEQEALRDDAKLKLLRAATLPENEGGGAYSVEWIEAPERPTFAVGFRVVPVPRTHKVALRVNGTPSILTISFQPTTATAEGSAQVGTGAPFETIPPWQTTLENVPDDAKIVLQSRIVQNLEPQKAFEMQVQIEVDGKLVRDQKSKGLPLSVDYEL